jgi:hypothetical protein
MFKFGNAMPNQNGMHKAVKVWLNPEKANDIWLMEMSTDILNYNLVFPSATWKCKGSYIYIYIWKQNFACCFICVWNLVCHVQAKTKAEGEWKQSAEGDIWVLGGGSNWRLEDSARWGASWFVLGGGGIGHICGSRQMHTGNERDGWEDVSIHSIVDWQQCDTAKFSMKKRKQRQNTAPVWSCQPTAVHSITFPSNYNIHTEWHHNLKFPYH